MVDSAACLPPAQLILDRLRAIDDDPILDPLYWQLTKYSRRQVEPRELVIILIEEIDAYMDRGQPPPLQHRLFDCVPLWIDALVDTNTARLSTAFYREVLDRAGIK